MWNLVLLDKVPTATRHCSTPIQQQLEQLEVPGLSLTNQDDSTTTLEQVDQLLNISDVSKSDWNLAPFCRFTGQQAGARSSPRSKTDRRRQL